MRVSQLEKQAAESQRKTPVAPEPQLLRDVLKKEVQGALFAEESAEPRGHMEIREESHACKISIEKSLHQAERKKHPNRRSLKGSRWMVYQLDHKCNDMAKLQTFAECVRAHNENTNAALPREIMMREAQSFLADIAIRRPCDDWLFAGEDEGRQPEALNLTSETAAFVRQVYDELIAADIITKEERRDAFDRARKGENPPTEETLRKWDVKLFPERIRDILFEKLGYGDYLANLQQDIQTFEWSDLLELVQNEGITTEEKEWAYYEGGPSESERDDKGERVNYISFDEFVHKIRRSPFEKVVGLVRERKASSYQEAWKQRGREQAKFFQTLRESIS